MLCERSGANRRSSLRFREPARLRSLRPAILRSLYRNTLYISAADLWEQKKGPLFGIAYSSPGHVKLSASASGHARDVMRAVSNLLASAAARSAAEGKLAIPQQDASGSDHTPFDPVLVRPERRQPQPCLTARGRTSNRLPPRRPGVQEHSSFNEHGNDKMRARQYARALGGRNLMLASDACSKISETTHRGAARWASGPRCCLAGEPCHAS